MHRWNVHEMKGDLTFAMFVLLVLTFAISGISRSVESPWRRFAWACLVGLILVLSPAAFVLAMCEVGGSCH